MALLFVPMLLTFLLTALFYLPVLLMFLLTALFFRTHASDFFADCSVIRTRLV